jgi:hypothetical protein
MTKAAGKRERPSLSKVGIFLFQGSGGTSPSRVRSAA